MKKFIKKILFKIEIWYNKSVLQGSDLFFAYPVIVDLEFNTDWYYNRYMKGISVKDSVAKKLMMITKRFERSTKRIENGCSPEIYHRLQRIHDHLDEQREINESIELGNKLIAEYERKRENS